jgi:hypothetical protein
MFPGVSLLPTLVSFSRVPPFWCLHPKTVRFSDNSAFLLAFLNIQNALPVELQTFQQTDNGHLIAKGLWSRVQGIEYEIEKRFEW